GALHRSASLRHRIAYVQRRSICVQRRQTRGNPDGMVRRVEGRAIGSFSFLSFRVRQDEESLLGSFFYSSSTIGVSQKKTQDVSAPASRARPPKQPQHRCLLGDGGYENAWKPSSAQDASA